MITVHIEDKPFEVVVSSLDCVVGRYDKSGYNGSVAEFVAEVLWNLGHRIEVEEADYETSGKEITARN